MKYNKKTLFEDLDRANAKPGDKDYRKKVQEFVKRFFIINEATTSQKTLDEIESQVSKFVDRVRRYWNHVKVQGHVDRMPLENEYFASDIIIVVERTRFVDVPVPPSPRSSRSKKPFADLSRSGKFSAAASVRNSHDSGAILMASYGAAKSTGQENLAKIIKETSNVPELAAKAVDGLTSESKHKTYSYIDPIV